MSDKPTKAFLGTQIEKAKAEMKLAEINFNRNQAVMVFCEEMIKRGIFIDDEVKDNAGINQETN